MSTAAPAGATPVEAPATEAPAPRPIQIVRTGDTNDFELCTENLEEIIAKIPPGMKVSVVSVVGAFRTGKSFLLSFFLRYLRHGDPADMSEDWMVRDGASLSEGNMNEGAAPSDASTGSFAWRGGAERQTTGIWMWSEPFIRSTSHAVRSDEGEDEDEEEPASCATEGGVGSSRKGKAHKAKAAAPAEDVAVLLVDTQGMFDNDTTMTVTSQVFGLSTLISSFQIYNVDKRIQEDNLQHLALFAEYGRMALDKKPNADADEDEGEGGLPTPPPAASAETGADAVLMPPAPPVPAAEEPAAAVSKTCSSSSSGRDKDKDKDSVSTHSTVSAESLKGEDHGFVAIKSPGSSSSAPVGATKAGKLTASSGAKTAAAPQKPFQHLHFLVRDWQNWPEIVDNWDGAADDEVDADTAAANDIAPALDEHEAALLRNLNRQSEIYHKLQYGMEGYISNVLRDRAMGDLQATREQITRCFEHLGCFWLPHPGSPVTRLNYNGSIKKIESLFRGLLNRFVRIVFDLQLHPKRINSHPLTGRGLQQFITVYCAMFQAGGSSFPKAMTMLEATSEANNRVALDAGKSLYAAGMERVAGVGCAYIKETELMARHATLSAEALAKFDDIATMGSATAITLHRTKLVDEITNLKTHYVDTNALRNPYKDMELYVLPCIVAAVSWLVAKVIQSACGANAVVCVGAERVFRRVFYMVLLVMLFVMWKQVSGALSYTMALLKPVVQQAISGAAAGNGASSGSARVGGGAPKKAAAAGAAKIRSA